MRRRDFIALIGAVWPCASSGEPRRETARIGWLAAGFPPAHPAFWRGMRELGYIEGDNVKVEYRWAQGKPELLSALADDLTRHHVALIFADGLQATLVAKSAASDIPVVFLTHADPVEAGLVVSLSRPAGMLTGLTMIALDLAEKRLQLLHEAVPAARHVAILANTINPGARSTLERLRAAANSLDLELQIVEAQSVAQIDSGFAAMKGEGAGAVYVNLDPLFFGQRTRIATLAAGNRLPAMYDVKGFVDAGGLMSYGPDFADLYHREAYFVDRLLRGEKPADLPVEQPTRFELTVNMKSAKRLGLTLSPAILARADEVLE